MSRKITLKQPKIVKASEIQRAADDLQADAALSQYSVFDRLPDSAWLRESQLVRSAKNTDSEVAPLPFSAPTLWRKVKDGSFPAPCKLSARVTAWKVSQVRAWMAAQATA